MVQKKFLICVLIGMNLENLFEKKFPLVGIDRNFFSQKQLKARKWETGYAYRRRWMRWYGDTASFVRQIMAINTFWLRSSIARQRNEELVPGEDCMRVLRGGSFLPGHNLYRLKCM